MGTAATHILIMLYLTLKPVSCSLLPSDVAASQLLLLHSLFSLVRRRIADRLHVMALSCGFLGPQLSAGGHTGHNTSLQHKLCGGTRTTATNEVLHHLVLISL